MNRADNLLEIKDLTVCYYKQRAALRNISLTVKAGEIMAIVGESGSGKSTLALAVLGLLPTAAKIYQGSIMFGGREVSILPPTELSRLRGAGLGMIFQDAGASFCPVRCFGEQIVEAVRQHTALDRQTILQQSCELLQKLRLDGERVLNSYPFQLSGGMNQRVAIMLAMLLRPQLLFADEPTSALDVTAQAEVLKALTDFRAELGSSIVMITHNIGAAYKIADRIAVLRGGELVECGSREEIFNAPQAEYTKQLIAAVPRLRRAGR